MNSRFINGQSVLFMNRYVAIVAILGILLVSAPVNAEMLVSPIRVQLDEFKNAATVTLRNPSDGPRTYRLMWQEKKVMENGTYVDYEEGEEVKHAVASPYLRLSPRQITVPPKGNQRVRIMYRPPRDMKKGEYRSHLLFKVVGEVSQPFSTQEIKAESGMTLKLDMQLSVAIPVVVKHQMTKPPQVVINNVEPILPEAGGGHTQLKITLQRSGLGGGFGRVVADMQADAKSPVKQIGLADNISVFGDVDQRVMVLNLSEPNIPGGAWIRVAYEGTEEFTGLLWDEQVFQVR